VFGASLLLFCPTFFKQVIQWLKSNTVQVLHRVEKGDDVMIDNLQTVRQETWVDEETPLSNTAGVLLLSEHLNPAAPLPAELIEQRVAAPQAHAPPANVPLPDDNPLMLFLRTLMPWQQVPNMPPP
jgi:hypothetical protein